MILVILALAGPAEFVPSPLQERVDKSFSMISIGSPLDATGDRLNEERADECENYGECAWRDNDGVRYLFWGGGPSSLEVAVKWIDASEFESRPIPALGIGSARERGRVLVAVRNFLSDADLECTDPLPGTSEDCCAFLAPGWVTIRFDASGRLSEVRLDGYHFT